MLIFAQEVHHEANSFFLPSDIAEFIWGTLAFLVVFGLGYWKLSPLIKRTMDSYRTGIERSLAETAEARSLAESKVTVLRTKLGDADTEAAHIADEAVVTAEQVKIDLMARAETDAESMRERASAEISASAGHASADLQAELARMTLGATEVVVAESLDAEVHRDLIENYINQVGAQP